MARYIVRRLLWLAVTLLLITLFTYVIFFVMPPSDPAVRFAGKPTELIAEEAPVRPRQALVTQYALFVKRIFRRQYGGRGWDSVHRVRS
jgi:peptide/nickel transport system permease protein